jgi:hypothetical protein
MDINKEILISKGELINRSMLILLLQAWIRVQINLFSHYIKQNLYNSEKVQFPRKSDTGNFSNARGTSRLVPLIGHGVNLYEQLLSCPANPKFDCCAVGRIRGNLNYSPQILLHSQANISFILAYYFNYYYFKR